MAVRPPPTRRQWPGGLARLRGRALHAAHGHHLRAAGVRAGAGVPVRRPVGPRPGARPGQPPARGAERHAVARTRTLGAELQLSIAELEPRPFRPRPRRAIRWRSSSPGCSEQAERAVADRDALRAERDKLSRAARRCRAASAIRPGAERAVAGAARGRGRARRQGGTRRPRPSRRSSRKRGGSSRPRRRGSPRCSARRRSSTAR